MIRRRPRKRTLAAGVGLAGVGCLVAGVLSAPAGAADSAAVAARTVRVTQVQAPVPQIEWHPCGDNHRFQCGSARVPLDYDNPDGATISLNLVKRPPNEPGRKIGSLFVNPGGPSGSAADFVPDAARLLGAPVRQRFAVIGIDPRGVAGSTPVFCMAQAGDPPLPPQPFEAFPRGERQISDWMTYDQAVRDLCAKRGNAILDHMSTADTVRDMDLIRQAVGDSQLTYYGISYGSMLGSTYAAMFPSRVRAIVVDGVLDPVQWTTGRFGQGDRYLVSARLGSGYGAWEALQSAFSECDRVGAPDCPYAGRIGAEWNKVIAKLRTGAVKVQGSRITYANLHGNILGGLYDADSYPSILQFIHQLYQLIFTDTPGAERAAAAAWTQLQAAVKRAGGTTPRYSYGSFGTVGASVSGDRISPQFQGVLCSDSVNPADESRAVQSAHYANVRGPGFGSVWSWASSQCPSWPGSGSDAFRGPWRHKTAHPIVVTGNLHDPATPISGARAVNKLFPGSRMITVDMWGHGALGHSSCVTSKWDAYFVSLTLPAPGLVCHPDSPLFP